MNQLAKIALLSAFGGVIAIFGYNLTGYFLEAARLFPTEREIIVRQVANGYVVEARVKNEIYPYKEYVFTDPAMAGSAVAGLLGERIPQPQWGR